MANHCQPNFFIIGAAKAATTYLSALLDLHPEAAIVKGKEVHFFSYDHYYELGWSEYRKLFGHCRHKKAVGDASTSYSRIRYHPYVVKRLWSHVPDAKIIYMVRHPLKRMESAYVEHLCSSRDHCFTSINEAVRKMPMIIDSSRYWEVYDAYRQLFGESRIKVVWFEEIVANPIPVFMGVCRFLGIDDSQGPKLDCVPTNSRQDALSRMAKLGNGDIPVDTVWDEKVRKWVIDQISDDNRRFLAHFGRRSDHWCDLSQTSCGSDVTVEPRVDIGNTA